MTFTLIWYGQEKQIELSDGQTILQAMQMAGCDIEGWCGSEGNCGECQIAHVRGNYSYNNSNLLASTDENCFLTCQSYALSANLIIEYPEKDYMQKKSKTEMFQDEYNIKLLHDIRISAAASISESINRKKELVLYHPDYWFFDSDWAKNLLLFSDGICLLIPADKQKEVIGKNEYFLNGLRDQGLIHVLTAEQAITNTITDKLRDAIENAIRHNLFDDIPNVSGTSLIHFSRLGFSSNYDSANWIYNELKKYNFIGQKEDGMYRIQDNVYSFIVASLAHLISATNENDKVAIYPITDRDSAIQDMAILSAGLGNSQKSKEVMMFDFQIVGADLSDMSVKDIVKYRNDHSEKYMQYARTVRQFLREIQFLPEHERLEAFADRELYINDLANELRKISRSSWGKPANFALTVAGAAISLVTNNPLPAAIFSTTAAISSLFDKSPSKEASIFSYVFNAPQHKRRF